MLKPMWLLNLSLGRPSELGHNVTVLHIVIAEADDLLTCELHPNPS